MDVKCEITEYTDIKVGNENVKVKSIFADGDKAKIEYKDVSFVVVIDELISALNKCRLNYRGI